MNQEDSRDPFDKAVRSLRERAGETNLTGFEHGVWTEIAIRDERTRFRLPAWLPNGLLRQPAPAAAVCALLAIVSGAALGLSRADAYDEQASLDMERRYVESIHPVMMSASAAAAHPARH